MDFLPIDPDAIASLVPVKITAEMADLLFAVVSEIEIFGTLDPAALSRTVCPHYRGMRQIGVPYRPTVWFPGLSPSRRRRYSRATMRLAYFAYFDRVLESQRDRITHVCPTLIALNWVITHGGDNVNRAHLGEGLRRCEWAAELHRQFREQSSDLK